VSDDGKFVSILRVERLRSQNGLWMPLKNGAFDNLTKAEPKIITLDFDAEYTPVGSHGNLVWVKKKPTGRPMLRGKNHRD
jgi:hypothetical protein